LEKYMSFVNSIINNKLSEAKELILARLEEIIAKRLQEAKRYVAEDMSEEFLDEAKKRNPNIIKMWRIQKLDAAFVEMQKVELFYNVMYKGLVLKVTEYLVKQLNEYQQMLGYTKQEC